MRNLIGLLAIGAFVVGISAPASSATLTLSGSSFSLTIGALPPITIGQSPASIPGVLVSSGGGSFTESASIFATNLALPTQLFTGVPLISGLTAQATNGAGSFTAAGGQGGGFGGSGALVGNSFVNVLFLFNLTVPLNNVGGGGTTMVVAGGLVVTATGNIWTTGAVVVSNVSTGAGTTATNTVTYTGFDNRTAGHAGTIQLVTPLRIVTSAAGTLPGFASQTLTFGPAVPEPGTLLLLGSGIIGLGLVGHRKLRK